MLIHKVRLEFFPYLCSGIEQHSEHCLMHLRRLSYFSKHSFVLISTKSTSFHDHYGGCLNFLFFFKDYTSSWMYVCGLAPVHEWRLEDSIQESVLSFYCVGPGDWTQVIRLDGKCLYLMSYLGGPIFSTTVTTRMTTVPQKTSRTYCILHTFWLLCSLPETSNAVDVLIHILEKSRTDGINRD